MLYIFYAKHANTLLQEYFTKRYGSTRCNGSKDASKILQRTVKD